MGKRYSFFSPPSFLEKSCRYSKRRSGHTLTSYSIIAAAIFLLTLLFSSPQVFAATAQNQTHQKALLPLSWSCGNPNSGHCYGTQFWGGANGADTRISSNPALSGGGTSNDIAAYSFVTTEMWLETTSASYWVEAGIISEIYLTGSTFPNYFWADQRPNGGGFSFHYLGNESPNDSVLVRITRSGSSTWNVLIRDSLGTWSGSCCTSTNNNFAVGYIMLGTELYNNFQTAFEPNIYYSNNRWQGSNGSFNYQGNDGVGTSIRSPVRAGWYNGQDPLHNSTGGVWYSCIPGYGC